MSRIGRLPIPLPSGVKIDVKGATVKVIGPKGELSIAVPDGITVKHEDSELLV